MRRPALAGRRTALAAALFCCALWGLAFPTVKAGLAYLTPTFFAGARFSLAGLAVLALAARRSGTAAILEASWRPVLVIGFFQTVIGYFLFFHGMKSSSGVAGSIITSFGTVMTAVMAYVFLGESGWSAAQVIGAGLGFAGVILALMQPGWRPEFSFRGEGMLFLSTTSIAYAGILAKRIAGAVDAMVISGGSMASGGLILLTLAAATEPISQESFTPKSVLLLLLAAFISAAAFTLWYALLRYNPISTISTVKFTIPIFGAILSVLLLGEVLTLNRGAGGLMVGLGIYLIFSGKEKGIEDLKVNGGSPGILSPP